MQRYFRKFVYATEPEVRQKVLDIVPAETRRVLQAQWAKTSETIRKARQHFNTGIDLRGLARTCISILIRSSASAVSSRRSGGKRLNHVLCCIPRITELATMIANSGARRRLTVS